MKISKMVGDITIADFDYPLPDERIARHPLAERDSCKLLLSRPDGELGHFSFRDVPNLLPPSSLLVANDTRVINARMTFYKSTGSRIEIFLLEPILPADYVLMFQSKGSCKWGCFVGNLKRWKEGVLTMRLDIDGVDRPVVLSARRGESLPGNAHEIEFRWDAPEVTFASIVDAAGRIPIPPYLKRESEDTDMDDYQTVYARVKGSVAAPTAGLHFTPCVLDAISAHNIDMDKVTLHVGAGTFQPVKSATIGEHPMHTETFSVTRSLVKSLLDCVEGGRKVIAVGTTTVRTLESLPYVGARILCGDADLSVAQWDPYNAEMVFKTPAALRALIAYMDSHGQDSFTGSTSIMIAPGFSWRIVNCMVTNFHQPQSTLLLLVSSFLDRDGGDPSSSALQWRKIYDEALKKDYRFLSYGDACLLFPRR